MTKRKILLRFVLLALPALAACTALSFFFVAGRADVPRLVRYTFVLASLALLLAVEAFWLYYFYSRSVPRLKRVGDERDFLRRRTGFLESRLSVLQDDVEVLSAMRQVARAAAAHDELDRILDETLKIIQDLVDARWVTVFVHDPASDAFVPRAHRKGSQSCFGAAIPPEVVDDTHVREAFRFESIIKEIENDELLAAVPAVSGGDKVGVVALSAPFIGTPDEKAKRLELVEAVLRDVAEHVAYALRAGALQTRAFEDDLTGLGNRGLFDERLCEMASLALRKNQPLSLILVDIDHFKNVNDTYGHQTGDRVLREVSALLEKSLRRYDTAYRYGGEELALLLPQTDLSDAVRLAERIRLKLEKKSFLAGKIRVTASFGAASLGARITSEEALVAAADAQMYRAKSLGRNRVEPSSFLSPKP